MTDLQKIVSDAEIERVHGYANFGDMSKREVVNAGVAQAALGYSMGHTQQQIITEHGLAKRTSGLYPKLTAKGMKYLHGMIDGHASEVISYISGAHP